MQATTLGAMGSYLTRFIYTVSPCNLTYRTEIVTAFWGLSVARGEGLNPLCPFSSPLVGTKVRPRYSRQALTFLRTAAEDAEHVVMTTNLLHHLHLVYEVVQLSFTRAIYSQPPPLVFSMCHVQIQSKMWFSIKHRHTQ